MDVKMKVYQFNVENFRQRYVAVSFLLMIFIVGCVGVQQEGTDQSTDQSFMVSIYQDSTNNLPQSIGDVTRADQHWQKGDIIYVANGYTDHMAMVDNGTYTASNSPDIIDSDNNGEVRRHNNLDKWADQGGWALIEGYYVSTEQSESTQRNITDNKFNVGDVYNAQTEITLVPKLYKRNSPPNTHSSQLVRHAYKYLYDIDLDADGGWWSWPKDIRQNPNLKAIPGALYIRS
jgi:hypothetical protein